MLQKPKGTYDIYGDKALTYLYFRKLVEALMDKQNDIIEKWRGTQFPLY